jgi:hypothetical protein
MIPWKEKILEVTCNDLKYYQGDLDRIERETNPRPMEENERKYKIRIVWKKNILWPTAEELKENKGDLNKLLETCKERLDLVTKIHSFRDQSHSFRNQNHSFRNQCNGYESKTNLRKETSRQ